MVHRGRGDPLKRGPRSKLAIISPSDDCRLSLPYPATAHPAGLVACRCLIRQQLVLAETVACCCLIRPHLLRPQTAPTR